ncbi:MAG: MOSC domain-containing protein [Bacteroidota bacterium]
MKKGKVLALSKSKTHTLNKYNCRDITLLKGLGVKGDAHMGKKVKHRSRVAKDPDQPNLRQVHLIHAELLEELREKNFLIEPGEMGENITTIGVDLLELPRHTILKIGKEAKIEITGLRNPCHQLNSIQNGLLKAVVAKDQDGNLIRKAGIMGIVLEGGEIRVGDEIEVYFPEKPYLKLDRV